LTLQFLTVALLSHSPRTTRKEEKKPMCRSFSSNLQVIFLSWDARCVFVENNKSVSCISDENDARTRGRKGGRASSLLSRKNSFFTDGCAWLFWNL
jgi:hypothetical protein